MKHGAAGVVAAELHRGFDGLGAGVGEEDLLVEVAGGDAAEGFGQFDGFGQIEVGARHVDKLLGLLLDGLHYVGVGVACGEHGDAGREVDEAVAVDVPDMAALAVVHHKGIRAGIGGRDDFRRLSQGWEWRSVREEDRGYRGYGAVADLVLPGTSDCMTISNASIGCYNIVARALVGEFIVA